MNGSPDLVPDGFPLSLAGPEVLHVAAALGGPYYMTSMIDSNLREGIPKKEIKFPRPPEFGSINQLW